MIRFFMTKLATMQRAGGAITHMAWIYEDHTDWCVQQQQDDKESAFWISTTDGCPPGTRYVGQVDEQMRPVPKLGYYITE